MSEDIHSDAHAQPPTQPPVPDTPEEVMQAASARIAALEAERDDYKDRWIRAEAETQNARTRARRDVDETRQFAVQKFARDVAEAADNIKRGLDSVPAPSRGEPDIVGRLRDGFAGVERAFVSLLERNGVARVDPTGAAFDPQPAPGDGRAGKRRAPSGDGDASLDTGMDAERAASQARHGGGLQSPCRRLARPGVRRAARHHRLVSAASVLPPGGSVNISPSSQTVGNLAVLRAARVPPDRSII